MALIDIVKKAALILTATGHLLGTGNLAYAEPKPDVKQESTASVSEDNSFLQQFLRKIGFVNDVDLDVTHISRTPRYPRWKSDSDPGKWPDVGEVVTYTANVINKGKKTASEFPFEWFYDGKSVATGTIPGLNPGEKRTVTFSRPWEGWDHFIKFLVNKDKKIKEDFYTNNSIEDKTDAYALTWLVGKSAYDAFNSETNIAGTKSFEDWVQAQMRELNRKLETETKYLGLPEGTKARVRVDEFLMVDDKASSFDQKINPLLYQNDGAWGTLLGTLGDKKTIQNYRDIFIRNIDGGLLHEVMHQLGVIDLYGLNIIATDVEIKDDQGKNVAGTSIMPLLHERGWELCGSVKLIDQKRPVRVMSHPGLMEGGTIIPPPMGDYGVAKIDEHTAYGLNALLRSRRGHFGKYLAFVPEQNKFRFLENGKPISEATIMIYQNHDKRFPNVPKFVGKTDQYGEFVIQQETTKEYQKLPYGTRSAKNPFSEKYSEAPNGVGTNGVLAIRLDHNGKTTFYWMDVADANVQYWRGNKGLAVYEFNPSTEQIQQSAGKSEAKEELENRVAGEIVVQRGDIELSGTLKNFDRNQNIGANFGLRFRDNSKFAKEIEGSFHTGNFYGALNSTLGITLEGDPLSKDERLQLLLGPAIGMSSFTPLVSSQEGILAATIRYLNPRMEFYLTAKRGKGAILVTPDENSDKSTTVGHQKTLSVEAGNISRFGTVEIMPFIRVGRHTGNYDTEGINYATQDYGISFKMYPRKDLAIILGTQYREMFGESPSIISRKPALEVKGGLVYSMF